VDRAKIHRNQTEDHHPHACTDGLVFLTYTAYDEEVERLDIIPCQRCASSKAEGGVA
jgi:hypothetical protein